ncbi:MAG TPA: M1 family peptidase, partial [Anaerolineae bacterium]|nr:M1 family peptidase [Anaerolineae bacterium]
MPFTDPHSYTDLTQGRIAHISLRMAVDFPSRVLSIVATYRLEQPASGSFYLDTRDLHIERVHAG